jgi:CDP-diacylglycerol--serine O-phosphatidyltransferase
MNPPARRRLGLRRRRQRRPRFAGQSFNRLVPNLLTMLGLCAGLTSMRSAIDGHFARAVLALVLAAAIDGIDGRIARLLRATSRFGAEFDSLSDFLCFGVAPAFILYLWAMADAGRLAFLPSLMFAVCMALRLARFNAALNVGNPPAYAYNFFSGVPAPAGAGLVLFPLFAGLEAQSLGAPWLFGIAHNPFLVAAVEIGSAALLVSTLPVWSFKNFRVPAEFVLPLLLGTGAYAAIVVAEPWAALAGAGVIYIALLPFARRSFHRLRADAENAEEEAEAGAGANVAPLTRLPITPLSRPEP